MSIEGFGGCTPYINGCLLGGFDAVKNQAITKGSTLPHVASQQGHLEGVRFLCCDGAEINQAKTGDRTPVDFFSGNDGAQTNQQGHFEEGRYFCVAGVSHIDIGEPSSSMPATADDCAAEDCGALPRRYGALARHWSFIFLLYCDYQQGAERSQAMTDGRAQLQVTPQIGHCEVIRLRCNAGAEKH